ncbi:tRNA (mo5U34)-methyltransferase [Candidatus Magnetomoraceae bacterium gMMP-1]
MKNISQMSKEELITEINVLGPWTHGYFDLGNGIIIQDQDIIQKKRLFCYRDYFIDIIKSYYEREHLADKTLCDIGCNTGYFMFELLKKFGFKKVTGLEPRQANLEKAQFIADYYQLSPTEYSLEQFDITINCKKLSSYDIIIMPGVLHHIDNHLNALKNIFEMTDELFIFESIVLPDEINSPLVAKHLELKGDYYNLGRDYYGVVGYKIESDYLDGSSYKTGIVGIPTISALKMMLYQVGFSDVVIYRNPVAVKKDIGYSSSYRDVEVVFAYALKNKRKDALLTSTILKEEMRSEENELERCVPHEILEPLYKNVIGELTYADMPEICQLIYDSEVYFLDRKGLKAAEKLAEKLPEKNGSFWIEIIKTFRYAYPHKVSYEYAKTCYKEKRPELSEAVAAKLISTCNLDWRVVYRSYHLLSLINHGKGDMTSAMKHNEMALRANAKYEPAIKFRQRLKEITI